MYNIERIHTKIDDLTRFFKEMEIVRINEKNFRDPKFAHHYYDMKEKEVLRLAKEIYIVKRFVECVKKIVSREEGK